MSRWPPVLTDSLEPRPEELDGLRPPCAPTWCAEATAPSEAELARLVAHAAGPRATPSLARARLAWALMAASILLAVLHLVPTPGDPVPPTGATAQLDGTLLRFGPSVTVSGQGAIEVIRSDEQGTVLALLTGQALFEVDPTGQRRQLTVRAGEVRVEVTGTRFMVRKDQARVSVEVSRGSVRIHRPSGSLTLSAGEHWGSTEQHGDPTVVPTAPPEAHTVVLGPTAAAEPAPPLGPSPLGDASPAEPTEPGPTASSHTAAQAWSTLLALRAAGAEPDAELAALEGFLAAHDDPILRAEADALRIGLLATQLPGEEVMPELDAWLAAHQDHARGLELELLRATVAREQLDDCALALPSYARVAREATGPLQASAQAWMEHCRGLAR